MRPSTRVTLTSLTATLEESMLVQRFYEGFEKELIQGRGSRGVGWMLPEFGMWV